MEQAEGEVREGKDARRDIVPISGERVVLLRSEEERMLAGGEGPATQKAMQLLVALGEVLGADRLIPIVSAQIAGVSYGNIGDAGMELLEDWAGQGGRVRVRSTLNPAGMDLERWREMGVDEEYHDRQLRIIKAFERMGVEITCTCTPYLVGNLPKLGDHIAWSESSAVCYANSVLGARTNREGGPSALAAALTGKTPRYGLHLDEGRRPTVVVEVKARLATTYDYSLLGYSVGRIIGSSIPYFNGVTGAEPDGLKIMSAALAASGGIAIFHIKGVTPEAEGQSTDGLERLCIDHKELEISREKLTADGDPDLACIGCPHASLGRCVIWRGRSGEGGWPGARGSGYGHLRASTTLRRGGATSAPSRRQGAGYSRTPAWWSARWRGRASSTWYPTHARHATTSPPRLV